MAINISAGPDHGFKIMALFDVDAKLIAQAKGAGVQVTQPTPGQFVVKYGGKTYGEIPLKGQAITLAKTHKMGYQTKANFAAMFVTALQKALVAAGHSEIQVPAPPSATYAPQKVAPPTPGSPATQAPTTKLADATAVFQSVKGTNEWSVYQVFAMYPGLNLGARLKGTKLSVRAEGKDLPKYMPQLKEFKMDTHGDYASAHYSVSGASIVKKTLGAIIGMLGYQNAKGVAELSTFVKE